MQAKILWNLYQNVHLLENIIRFNLQNHILSMIWRLAPVWTYLGISKMALRGQIKSSDYSALNMLHTFNQTTASLKY